ncbi:hypothetical protein SUGI_0747330 [Cryptomeria japonica]|nr:hypothetical protein SUGI_0747330 [Cryptomeria japonica]
MKKDKSRDASMDELKTEFENNIDNLSCPKAFNSDNLNKLARIDTMLTCKLIKTLTLKVCMGYITISQT